MKFNPIVFAICFLISNSLGAQEFNIAVASNFSGTAQLILQEYSKKTGHKFNLISGASGKLYSQILAGAPFEVLLSADSEVPKKLVDQGLALQESRFTYALGKLVLWSAQIKDKKLILEILIDQKFKHLALANPTLAPYGLAAMQVLQKWGLWTKIQPELVMGENIAQAFQFILSGNAELGFVAYSQIIQKIKEGQAGFWLVPSDQYLPIRQEAILLKKGQKNNAAIEFLVFLKSEPIRKIILESGYDLDLVK